jgi:hypothetical protein
MRADVKLVKGSMMASSVLNDLSAVLKEIVLPEPLRWLDDDVVRCTIGRAGATGGYSLQFLSWLMHASPIPCCHFFSEGTCREHGDPKFYFWRVQFDTATAWKATDWRTLVVRRVLDEAQAFLTELAAGRVPPTKDCEELP